MSCKDSAENKQQKSTNAETESQENPLRVLIVLTSQKTIGDADMETGFWLEEFASPYYTMLDQGIELEIATPIGGKAPIDPRSMEDGALTTAAKRYLSDTQAQQRVATTRKLSTIDASNFDGIFNPGGHGPMWDLAESEVSAALIEDFYRDDKPIGMVCHAPAALKGAVAPNGDPLIKGKKVTGFTNDEEKAVNLADKVPFLLETMLKEKGADFSKAPNFNVHVVEDDVLVTGQNPASAEKAAELFMEKLHENENN
ncbi:type 1 glutamine amidotransferase domain-containing protein [Gangjinia marincola]|uniref:Type 1 glutamine amidotransferase domain-containing protein n=1 Tax=Gangjinia marincola TaxID=578463 RepID=A0ABP3XRY0_9FLAO